MASDDFGSVAVLVGHDVRRCPLPATHRSSLTRARSLQDDVVLGPTGDSAADRRERSSRWAGMQSDRAIVAAMRAAYPSLNVSVIDTVEQLRATDAEVVLVVSYKTQPGYGWYARFFGAMRELEARGVTVYPSADFKECISCKGTYARLLQAAKLPLCPTEVVDRSECTDAAGEVDPRRMAARMQGALHALGLASAAAPGGGGGGDDDGGSGGGSVAAAAAAARRLRLVTKPSNADGGFGVAFWEAGEGGGAPAGASKRAPEGDAAAEDEAVAENVGLQAVPAPEASACAGGVRGGGEGDAGGGEGAALLRSLQLRCLLTCGCEMPAGLVAADEAASGDGGGAAAEAPSSCSRLRCTPLCSHLCVHTRPPSCGTRARSSSRTGGRTCSCSLSCRSSARTSRCEQSVHGGVSRGVNRV